MDNSIETLKSVLESYEKRQSEIRREFMELHPTITENGGARRSNLDDAKKFPDFADKLAEYNHLSRASTNIWAAIREVQSSKQVVQRIQYQTYGNALQILQKVFPNVNLQPNIYQADGSGVYAEAKSVDQLTAEKDDLYQKTAAVQGTIQQRQQILKAIDVVYDKYINEAKAKQETSSRSR